MHSSLSTFDAIVLDDPVEIKSPDKQYPSLMLKIKHITGLTKKDGGSIDKEFEILSSDFYFINMLKDLAKGDQIKLENIPNAIIFKKITLSKRFTPDANIRKSGYVTDLESMYNSPPF
jgi:hypothetical protein